MSTTAGQLTEDRRRLVEGHLELGRIVAAEVHTRLLDRDERLSAAYLGICLAARDWPGGDDDGFRGYARVRARWAIAQEIRSRRRRPAERFDDEADIADDGDPFAGILARDEAAHVRSHFRALTARQRAALKLYLKGHPIPAIGSELGIGESGADKLIRVAIEKLRKATAPDGGKLAPRPCEACGYAIPDGGRPPRGGHPRRFCCERCRKYETWRRRAAEEHLAAPDGPDAA